VLGVEWTARENAIHAWVSQATGLAADHVLWANRKPVPNETWAQLTVDGLERFGRDWLERTAVGDDVRYNARGLRSVTLQIQLFEGDELGETSCVALLDRVISALGLPSVAAALAAAGVGVGAHSAVRYVPGRRNTAFEPRAVIEFTLNFASDLSEVGPRIKHVEVEGALDDVGTTSTWSPESPTP
jgi:hypothetical protein